MRLDGRDADEDSSRGAALLSFSLQSPNQDELRDCRTYQASSADSEGRSRLANSAVSGGDDSVRVQQSTTTEVRTTLLQADNVGELASCSGCSTDDVILGGGCSNDCGSHKAGEECFVLHLEEVLGSDSSECWKRISEWMILFHS